MIPIAGSANMSLKPPDFSGLQEDNIRMDLM
jgi:hypothetical protein